jgi:hypothetical protein
LILTVFEFSFDENINNSSCVRENRKSTAEWTIQRHGQHWSQDTIQRHGQHWSQDTIQRHGQHWSQDTERRKTKHKNTLQHKKLIKTWNSHNRGETRCFWSVNNAWILQDTGRLPAMSRIVGCTWIYIYLCNMYLKPIQVWIRIPFMRGVLYITLCDKVFVIDL